MTKGYDNLPMFYQTVLDIPLFEGVGLVAHDISRAPATALDKTMTIHVAPPWMQLPLSGISFLDCDATNPDFLDLAQAESTDMDFTAGAFSLLGWFYFLDITLGPMLFCRGVLNVDGWYMNVLNDGSIRVYTNQAGDFQFSSTAAGAVVINTWYMIAATRLTDSVRIYVNGIDVTDTAGTHTNPLTANRELHIGCYDDELSNGLHGYLAHPGPRIWSRQLSATEIAQIFRMERGLFGV